MQEDLNNKKKVLYVITKGNFGGAQRYVYDLATNLPKDQFEVVVACGPNSAKAPLGKEGLISMLQEKGIRVISLRSSQRDINIFKDIKSFFEILKIIKEEKPNILNLNSSKVGGLGSLAGRIAETPKIIFTAHGWAFNENRGLISKAIILSLHWFTVLLAHTTLAVSEKTKRDLSSMPFIKNKIKAVHNGIEDFDTLPTEESRRILSPNDTAKTILFSLSELHPSKGFDVALRGLAKLPKEIKERIVYTIAGSGDEKENLENLSKELGIQEMVNFLGFVENAKKLLSGADIFLFPSRNENLPFAILEAGLKGLPIIATSVGGIPEIITDMQSRILVHPNNPKEIKEAILYFLDHPEKQKEFGLEIKKIVSENFSLEKMVSETLKI